MQLKPYIELLILTALMLTHSGCTDPYEPEPVTGEGFSISISVPLASSSRAMEDALNEFKVHSLHLYFFQDENFSEETSEYLHDVAVSGEFEYSRQLRIAFPENVLKEGGLFGLSSDRCHVYAVANVDEGRLTARTVAGLKATVVGSNFAKTTVQDIFAMDGQAMLNLDRSKQLATGTIILERAASKLILSVALPDFIDVEQTITDPFGDVTQTDIVRYYSRAQEMRVWLANGVKESPLNTTPAAAEEERLYSNEISAAEGCGSPFVTNAGTTQYTYVQQTPFYSYPHKWDAYTPTGNCFMTLVVPWYYTDKTGNIQNVVTYYRLSIRQDMNYIERNTLYDMRVTISRLGGTSVQTPVDMLFDWNYAMEWNEQTLPTDIKEIRYLLLNNNDFNTSLEAYSYVMENAPDISIPYSTSHSVKIESVSMTWRDFYNNADHTITLTDNGTYKYSDIASYSPLNTFAAIEIDARNSRLKIHRDQLHVKWDNTTNRAAIENASAINDYILTIRICHTDAQAGDASAHATIVVTQTPAISISTQLTASGTRFVNKNNKTYEYWNYWSGYEYRGYVTTSDSWPSGSQRQGYWLGSIHDSNNYVKNKNTYILSITKFSSGANYIIGDPRTRSVDNLNASGTAVTAAAEWTMEDNDKRQMQNYYPADESGEKKRFIAPKLRVASQWGVTYNVSRTGAKRRCASYQEDGRPAGRWRLPTIAEIEYISSLSAKKYIPYLFGTEGNTADYWCASGAVKVDNAKETVSEDTSGENRHAVRCVYDEWFWSADTLTNKKVFTWGDRKRSSTGN